MLWVSALAALGAAVFTGEPSPPKLSSNALTLGTGPTLSEMRPADPSDTELVSLPRTLPPIDAEARMLFRVDKSVQPEVAPPPPVAPVPTPILKGITSSGRDLVAVFSADPNNPTAYVIAPVGSDVGGYTVLSVEPDHVAIRGPDGVSTTLVLRGSGESH